MWNNQLKSLIKNKNLKDHFKFNIFFVSLVQKLWNNKCSHHLIKAFSMLPKKSGKPRGLGGLPHDHIKEQINKYDQS